MKIRFFDSSVIKAKSMYNSSNGINEIMGYISERKGRLFITLPGLMSTIATIWQLLIIY